MTNDVQKNELLDDFRKYLEEHKPDSFISVEQPDLSTLLTEMAGLKMEVKAESRQFKTTLDLLSSALVAMQEDNKSLSDELAKQTKRFDQQQNEIMKAMLLDIVDIYDRLTTGLDILQNYQPVSRLLKRSAGKDILFIKRFKEGQLMTIRRFEQVLQRYQVQAIDCVGKLFNPVTMSAVRTDYNPKFDIGVVLEELRKGFLFQDTVLRLAEVKVNKVMAKL
jgi:molecular chaperone GrpE